MIRWVGLMWAGCTSGSPTVTTDSDTGTSTDRTTRETGTTDTATEPALPRIRAIHVGASLPAQDMLGNGNRGQPPLVDLAFGETWPLAGSATRPAGEVTFTFHDDGDEKPWATFAYELVPGSTTSLIVHGTLDDRDVLVTDDHVDAPADRVRMRWTHAAPSLGPVILADAASDREYADGTALAYGDTVEVDEAPGEVNLWLDIDGDEACSVGEVFAAYERPAGDYFHVLITEASDGALFLKGHTLDGQGPARELADACP